MFEPLKQALGGKVTVYFICTTIHDTRMPSMDFIGPAPRRTSYVHEAAMEHRARICKMFYMGCPDCTSDYLLDDMAQRYKQSILLPLCPPARLARRILFGSPEIGSRLAS